jgi:tRNA pseudouridine synthase 9
VRPYYFDYFAFVKTRWAGRGLIELFTAEFQGRPREYYEAAHAAGRLRVEDVHSRKAPGRRGARGVAAEGDADAGASGDAAAAAEPAAAEAAAPQAPPRADAPLRDGQRIRHYVHRHEPPVRRPTRRLTRTRIACLRAPHRTPRTHTHRTHACAHALTPHPPQVLDVPITILATTDTAVAVCKPASMPVHPTGQYRKNSVLGILASEARGCGLRCARGDACVRMRTADAARSRTMQHAALGRLCPVHRLDRNVSGLLLFARGGGAANALRLQICAGGVVKEYVACVAGAFSDGPAFVVEAPLLYCYKSRTTGVSAAPAAKPAATAFRLLAHSADGRRSLVACRPLTGRTHQARPHARKWEHARARAALQARPC